MNRVPVVIVLVVTAPAWLGCAASDATTPEAASPNAPPTRVDRIEDAPAGLDDVLHPSDVDDLAGSHDTCEHANGGIYGAGACTQSSQCCAGAFVAGNNACGPCSCVEPRGHDGCGVGPTDAGPAADADAGADVDADAGVTDAGAAVPVTPGASCTHEGGGVFAHGGCAADAQCCDGVFHPGSDHCGACACVEPTGAAPAGATGCVVGPPFIGTVSALPADVVALMTGSSWRPGCPVGLEELRLLELSHHGFDGLVHTGELVVAAAVADDVVAAFAVLYDAGYPIERMRLVDHYDADDDLSMADNNTSAFNCRNIAGSSSWSQHSYGSAIDINPVQNPYVRTSGGVDPPNGAPFADRSLQHPAMIHEDDAVTDAFDAIDWGWGGRWGGAKDYQHFSESGG